MRSTLPVAAPLCANSGEAATNAASDRETRDGFHAYCISPMTPSRPKLVMKPVQANSVSSIF